MRPGQSKSLETPAAVAAASQNEGAANAGDSGRGKERAKSAQRVAVLRPQTSFGDGRQKPTRKIADDNSAAGVGVMRSLGHEQWAAAGLSENDRDGEICLGAFAVETAKGTKTNIRGAERVRSKHDKSGLSGKEPPPSLPSATGVSGARPKLALRRTESSLSGKWAPTGATRLDRRISAREAAERIRRSNVVGDKPLRNGAQPKKARPWVPPGAAPRSSTGIGGTQGIAAGIRKGKSSKPIVSSARGRKKDVRGLTAEENDETSACAKGACPTGSSSGTVPKRDPAKRDAADARQGLRAMTSVLPGQGKNTIFAGLQVDEMVETRGDADGFPAASSSGIVAVESDAPKRDDVGAIEGSSIMKIVSYGQGRKELVRGSSSEETSESRFGKYFVRSTGEVPGAVGEGDVAAIGAAKREATNALELSPSLKNTSPIRGRKEVVRSLSIEPKAEMRGRADAFCPFDRSPGAAAESDAAKRDAADSKEGAPGMMNVSLARGGTEFPWGPLAEEVSERRGYADSVPSARSSPFVTAKSDVVSHAAVTLEGSQAMKSLSPMRGQKEVVRGLATEEMAETRDGGPGYVRATGSSSYDVANNDGAAREAVDAIEYWSALKSLSPVRGRKTVVRKPLADEMPMMKGDLDGSRPTDPSPSAAPKSDARKRDAAYARDVSRGMESISPSRGSKKVAQRSRAKEIVEMSDADGAPATSSSSGVAARSDVFKLYTADAREGSTGMTAVRGSSAENKAEARADAYDVRGSGGLVSAPSTSGAAEQGAENSRERSPIPKDVRPGRKRKQVREAPTEEMVGVGNVPGSIHAISKSSSVTSASGAAKRDSAGPRGKPLTTKSVPRGRSTKKVRRGRPTKEDIAIRGGTDSARAIGTSAGAAVKDDAAKRQTADANERSPVVDSVSLGRGNKKGIRNKPRDGKAEKRDCVDGPSAAAIRDLVYAAGLSPEKKRAPPRRKGKNIDRGPPAEGETETMSNADGTSATGSSRSAAPKNAAAKRGSAKVRPLAKKSIPSVRGRKRVRKPPIEDQVEMRDGAAGAQGILRSSSAAAKSVAPKSDSPMRASSKRNAADNIEGLTAKKSVPPGRGRKKGREVSPKLRSPDAHLDFMRSLAPEPPRHGVLSAPTPSLFLPTDSDGKPAVPRERAANSAWDLEHFVALPDEKEAEAELVATGKRCHEVEDGVVEGDGRKVGGKGEARVTAGGSSFPSTRSIDMNEGMEEDPRTVLKNLQDAILNTLNEAKPNDQKTLFEPQEYGALGGYFEGVQQPFEIMVHPNVRFVADIHSYHMEKAEVIGVLAGRLDREKRVLYIQAAIPVKEATMPCGHRGHTEVEMDPVWSLNVNERIRSLGMQMVGWYHSHPKFKNIPSLIDVQNQEAFQAQFESDSGNPWVGMIVGRNHSPSDFLFFRNESVSRENCEPVACPMLLRTRLLSSTFSTAALAAAAAATNAKEVPTHVRDEDFTSAAFSSSLALLPPLLAAVPSPAPAAREYGESGRTREREAERAKVARADVTRRRRKARLLNEQGDGDTIAQNNAVTSAVGSPSPAGNAQSSSFSRVGMASVHLDEAIVGRRDGMAPAPEKRGHYGVAPHAPVQGFSLASSNHGVESGVSVESSGIRSSKATKSGEGKAAAAAARAGLGCSVHDRRERLFDAVSTIAGDPPFIFSQELECVLKGEEVVCAAAGGGGDDSGGVGQIVGGYGPEMDSVIDSLMNLGRYYARVSGRAKWWDSRGTPALEKLARSMAQTVDHMELCPPETNEFVQDACSFLSACFRETSAPRRRRGTAQKREANDDAGNPRPKRTRRSVCRDS